MLPLPLARHWQNYYFYRKTKSRMIKKFFKKCLRSRVATDKKYFLEYLWFTWLNLYLCIKVLSIIIKKHIFRPPPSWCASGFSFWINTRKTKTKAFLNKCILLKRSLLLFYILKYPCRTSSRMNIFSRQQICQFYQKIKKNNFLDGSYLILSLHKNHKEFLFLTSGILLVTLVF